jgi:hypothetical protein
MIPSQWVDVTISYGDGITRLRFKDVDIYRNNGWIFDKRASCVQTIYNIRYRDYCYKSGVGVAFGCTIIICIRDGEVGIKFKNHLTVSSFSQELYKIQTKRPCTESWECRLQLRHTDIRHT